MARYQGVETDLNGAIVPGAKIYVYQFDGQTLAALTDDYGGTLPNPVISDSLGGYYFNVISQGLYYLKHQYSGRYELFEITAVGELIAAVNSSPANAGKFIALDADGAPTYASGTGADAALRTDLAAPGGSALSGFLQAGTGAVAESLQTWSRRVGIWPEQFGARVGGFDDARLVKAIAEINAHGGNRDLYLADDFTLSTGDILALTNASNVRIHGPGRLILDGGAADEGSILNLIGTCDNIILSGTRFSGPGRTDSAAKQYGFHNNSGQTLSKIWVDSCAFENLNLAISIGTESAGSVTNAIFTRNIIKHMTGTLGGQGYGINCVGITDAIIAYNQIEYAERHSIYVSRLKDTAGTYGGVLVDGNIIRNHRQTVNGLVTRPAIFMGRGYGGKISNNFIADYWDGAIGVGQDTGGGGAPVRQCGDIEISDNTLVGRRNAIASIQIAEPLVPTTARIDRIDVKRNKLFVDLAVATAQYEIEVYNGSNINLSDNNFYLANVANGTERLIAVGTIAGAGDVANVYVERNKVAGTAAGTPSLVNFATVYLPSAMATGTAKIVVRANDNDTGFTSLNVEYAATRTNPNIVDQVPGQLLTGVYTAGSTTPSVAGGIERFVITNASATTITNFLGGVDGQQIMLTFTDSNTTLQYNTNLRLPSASNIVGALRRTVVLVKSSGVWMPVSDITGS
ncbi:hypothetical protein FPZ24_08105 [Sphingomonas panacisoli]|uniref:Right handed beta helix domain-containing protein n=1 Tax=Sphingomonas panacisoli TaxID=1813879 RepID=A0A5B8LHU9_9SPHN|nr:hypothetical protein [Sphingomonas panacisoli]QDZ07446.1 hypothetical protein FPZ24_08105 [Sphingomonas panacisoli]